MNKDTIAIFDFDGTITSKDTLVAFINFSKGKWSLWKGFLLFTPLLIAMKLKLYPNWRVKEKVFSYFFKGVSLAQFNKWGHEFSMIINDITRVKATEAIRSHLASQNCIMIISASIENWVSPWAQEVGIETVLATKVEVDSNQKLTGRFCTKNCYGAEKVNRFLQHIPNRKDFYIIAYGDSSGDKEMIEFADKGYYNKFK